MSKTLKINLDMSKRQWELDTMDMSKTSFGHVQLSNIIKSNWTCPKDSPDLTNFQPPFGSLKIGRIGLFRLVMSYFINCINCYSTFEKLFSFKFSICITC